MMGGSTQTLRRQFGLMIASLVAGMLCAGAVALTTLERLKVNGPLYNDIVMSKDLIADVLPPPAYIVEAQMVALSLPRATSAAERATLTGRFAQLEKEFKERIAFWTNQPITASTKDMLVNQAAPAAAQFFSVGNTRLLPAITAGDTAGINAALAQMGEHYARHRAAINTVVEQSMAHSASVEAAASTSIGTARILMLLAFAAAVAFTAVITIGFGRRLLRQLGGEPAQAVALAQAIAAGRLSSVMPASGGRDDLMASMAQMNTALRQTVGDMVQTSQCLSGSSATLNEAAAHVATGSQQQSDAAAATAAAVEQFAVSLAQITGNAQEAHRSASEADQVSERAGTAVARSLDEIKAIASTVHDSAELMTSLEHDASRISKVIAVINDIAEQTNLLALNAAIEAARAGEQGRGFAVVADEVRKLAQRTSQSTTEITDLVAAIQNSTRAAAAGLAEGNRKVDNGVERAGEARDAMREQVECTRRMLQSLADISDALHQQSAAREEVTRNVETIARMTDGNMASVGTIRESAQALDRLAEELRHHVARFQL